MGGGGGWGARVSEFFFYKESKSKKKFFLRGRGSKCISELFFRWVGGGCQLGYMKFSYTCTKNPESDFFYKESNSYKNKKRGNSTNTRFSNYCMKPGKHFKCRVLNFSFNNIYDI